MEVYCNFCLKPFDAKRESRKFCSDSHKVMYSKLSAEEKLKKDEALSLLKSDQITTANKVPPLIFAGPKKEYDSKRTDKFINDEPSQFPVIDEKKEIGLRLQQFCKQNKTNVEDLFEWLSNNYGKKTVVKSGGLTHQKAERPAMSNFRNELREKKTGYKGKSD